MGFIRMAKIRITNLKLHTLIGIYEHERIMKQDVIVNIVIDFDAEKVIASDDLKDTIDYHSMTQKIIAQVENSSFFLLEKLANMILDIVMEDKLVDEACVRVDKPNALRFADSAAIELSKKR